MVKYFISLFYLFCFYSVSSSFDLTDQVSTDSGKPFYDQKLIVNQYEFEDKLKECTPTTLVRVSGPIDSKIDKLLEQNKITYLDFTLGYINDEELKKICESLTGLKYLNLTGSNISNDSISSIKKLSLLEELIITHTYITSSILEMIPATVKVRWNN